jgi:uncharacterized protein
MTGMVEVMIDSVRVSLTNQQRIVLLRELERERYLPIWIGPFEAEAITISLQEIEVARPQTHDLLISSLEGLNARLLRVEVIALKGEVFYGNLVVDMEGQSFNVDARPSDCIALAVRAHVPILVDRQVMREAAIVPEADVQAQVLNPESEDAQPLEPEVDPEEARKRLSVFEDFLKNVNLGDDPPDRPRPRPGQ